MTAEELFEDLEIKVAILVADQAAWLAQQFRHETPANLTRTRAGIYWKATGLTAHVGIRFARRYAGSTPTGQRLQRQWNELRPQVRQQIISGINDILKG
jgi:hypothetical protein